MRLILDEHFSHLIAQALRERSQNVWTVTELDLAGTSDEQILAVARDQGRALVTNNTQDFVPLEHIWIAAGEVHHGIIYTDDASAPRGTNQIGEIIRRLERELIARPEDDALRGISIFLSP